MKYSLVELTKLFGMESVVSGSHDNAVTAFTAKLTRIALTDNRAYAKQSYMLWECFVSLWSLPMISMIGNLKNIGNPQETRYTDVREYLFGLLNEKNAGISDINELCQIATKLAQEADEFSVPA